MLPRISPMFFIKADIMTDFTAHTIETAPAEAKPMLEGAKQNVGFVPNLYANMAEAPALLEAYLTISKIFDKASLSPTERQIILMTNNRLNGCHYCMAAHTTIMKGQKLDEGVIAALRSGVAIDDAKLEALRQFAIVVNETRGNPSETDIEALLAAGYTRQTVLEVVLGTGIKTLSNYTNHIVKTEVDPAFAPNAWSPADLADD